MLTRKPGAIFDAALGRAAGRVADAVAIDAERQRVEGSAAAGRAQRLGALLCLFARGAQVQPLGEGPPFGSGRVERQLGRQIGQALGQPDALGRGGKPDRPREPLPGEAGGVLGRQAALERFGQSEFGLPELPRAPVAGADHASAQLHAEFGGFLRCSGLARHQGCGYCVDPGVACLRREQQHALGGLPAGGGLGALGGALPPGQCHQAQEVETQSPVELARVALAQARQRQLRVGQLRVQPCLGLAQLQLGEQGLHLRVPQQRDAHRAGVAERLGQPRIDARIDRCCSGGCLDAVGQR
jgi:hypothetical protein